MWGFRTGAPVLRRPRSMRRRCRWRSPVLSSGLAWPELQSPPVPVAPAVETTGPAALGPSWIAIVTGVLSDAVPENDGVVSFEGDFGRFKVTSGGPVSTLNVTGALTP